MKVTIYFQPARVVALLGVAAAALWTGALALAGVLHLLLLAGAVFYTALLGVALYALGRARALEGEASWDKPERLLVLAPHEDDCVIAAGGIGARNLRLGGAVRIVYLVPDEQPGLAEIRAREAHAAWREAGLAAGEIRHIDVLPRLRIREPEKLRAAAGTLRSIIDDFAPTVLVMPMFEGGHIQHDMTAGLVGRILTPQDRFIVYEAPEYGPYMSLNNTPHRVLGLCARWLMGLVSYCGPPDGIDGRTLLKFHLDPQDLACKRRMLAAFTSQNAPSLVATYGYADRLALWDPSRVRRHPYDYRCSYLRLSVALRRFVPAKLALRLLGVRDGAIGREGVVTDWDREWSLDAWQPRSPS